MINGDVKQFIDDLYYGTENIFVYEDHKYMIQGWWSDKQYWLGLQQWAPTVDGYVWEHSASTPEKCVNVFLETKLFRGKTFLEAERQMEWVDY